jgi:hypothetical protein
MCAVAVEVQHGQITLDHVAHSSIGYVVARTRANLAVNRYMGAIRQEHQDLHLPEVGFSAFIWLADQLKDYDGARSVHNSRLGLRTGPSDAPPQETEVDHVP